MVVARVFPAVNLASVFLWSRLVDTHARAMLNFCGHKNSSIYVALPSVGALLLLDALAGCRRSVRSALLCIVALLQCLISYSATSIAKLFVLAALMAVVQFRGVRPFMSGLSRLGTCGILSLFIMVWPVREGFFSPLIEGVQGKTLTFAGGAPLFGTACWTLWSASACWSDTVPRFGSTSWHRVFRAATPPHSFLLYLWLSGGYRLSPVHGSSGVRHEGAFIAAVSTAPRQCLPLRWRAFSRLVSWSAHHYSTAAFRDTCVLLEVSGGNAAWLAGCHPLPSAGRF